MSLHFLRIQSPIDDLYLVADKTHLQAVIFGQSWADYAAKRELTNSPELPVLKKTARQLDEYFSGRRREFDLPYKFEAGTEFQRKVWLALADIPYGKTVSYKQQALAIGKPKAVRAVGGSNGLNPLAIVLPCHRVIGSSGKLTGFGGGIDKKEFLLRLEGVEF